MSSVGSPAPSGEESEQSRQGDSAASGDQKQSVSEEKVPTPEPSTSTENKKEDRKSRRKPKVTRKVVESEEEDVMIGGIGFEAIDELLNSMIDPMETDLGEDQTIPQPETVPPKTASPESPNQCPDVTEEEENFVLPEGTVVVQPEEVTEDQTSQFQGPEFKTSGGRRQVMKGDLDNEIIHCTACNKQINSNSSANVKRHPVLKVLICKKCYKWYTSDEIDQDSDGMDEQCRWCGDGGDLLLCDSCNNAFCKGCIRRNLGRKELSEILEGDDSKWQCYVCDPKPLAALIHNCTQIIKSVEAKEKENLTKPEKGRKEKDREKPKPKSEESSSSASSGTKPVKSATKPSPAQIKGAQKMSSINVSPLLGGAQPVAVTTRGVTYIVQPQQTVKVAPQQGLVYQAHGNQLIPVKMAPTPPKIVSQGGSSVQMIPDNWNINEHNATHVLDRVLAATQSMNMLLFSLKDDVKKKTQGAGPQDVRRAKSEMAIKLKRALHAYKKSFQDISTFANASRPKHPPQSTSVLQKQLHLASSKKGKKSSSQVEVIELSDSDDDNTSSTSTSVTKTPHSDKDKSQSSEGEGKVKQKSVPSTSSVSKQKSGFNLKVAMFSKGSLSMKKTKTKSDQSDSEHDAKSARDEPSDVTVIDSMIKTGSGTDEENSKADHVKDAVAMEVTEIDLDNPDPKQDGAVKDNEVAINSDGGDKAGTEDKDEKEGPDVQNIETGQDKESDKPVENGAEKTEGESSDDLPDLLKETSKEGSASEVHIERESSGDKASDINMEGQEDPFESLKFEPLFDIDSLDSSKRRLSSELEEPDTKKQKKTVSKRSREDIEAQRMLHKELLEDSSNSGQSVKESDPMETSTSEQTSEDKASKNKSSGEEYVPEMESRESRKDKLKSSAAAKFKGENSNGKSVVHSEFQASDGDDDDVIMLDD